MERSTMSVQELSSQMGISLPKAYELVKQPGFPVLRIGTRILIPVDSFNAWLIPLYMDVYSNPKLIQRRRKNGQKH